MTPHLPIPYRPVAFGQEPLPKSAMEAFIQMKTQYNMFPTIFNVMPHDIFQRQNETDRIRILNYMLSAESSQSDN